ncbi:hypothetical protein O3M35_006734 [Rhynocoris fuscipes]|uniref:C3H1-type domain-containing protein n=1 Tax=Rhynocoris fuscipes TaxID=488301 RepID=A0AAW1DFW9_9HEMI
MSTMEISELTDAILSDDYEEGEILDEDTLYDNVSSLEEFSGSDTDIKYDSSVLLNKLSSNGRKEKHHRRKEHKCKDDSICRKERSGKHCYARIRKNKIIENSEKPKVIDLTVSHNNDIHNQKKKTHVIASPVHDGSSKYNSNRRQIAHKDVPEKENRSSHRHSSRHYDGHKSPPYRIDKKKFSERIKKHLVNGPNRSYENRKRARSQSPKSHYKNHIKETNAPRGGSSLLKRLVGSGSIGVKTPKEIEEPKKINDKCDIELCKTLVRDEKSTEIGKETENQVNNESIPKKEDSTITNESEKVSCVDESISENVISLDDSFENLLLADTLSESHESDDRPVTTDGDAVKAINDSNDIPDTNTNCESSNNISAMISDASKNVVNTEEINEENIYKNDLNNEYDSLKKNDQLNDEEIDELSLRLEALRTAMLRKHKERQKRGFIRKKKTNIEDDSFAEYALSHVDLDNSILDQNVESIDSEKNDNDLVLDSNCKNYTSPVASNSEPLQYSGTSEFSYYQVNSNELTDDFNTGQEINEDFNCFIKSRRSFKNQSSNNSVAHCLKEINSNKEHLTDSKKRIKKLSSKYKSRRSKGLESAKRRYGRAVMERKLFRREYAEQKRLRKDLKIIKTNSHIDNQLNEDGSDEECALRELALKSVKEKDKIMNSNETSDPSFIQTTKDNITFRNDQIKVDGQDIFNNLTIDIDNNINVRPLVSCDSESTPTNLSSNEWDDIDEDILRAQLLSSLSLRIKKEEETQVFSKKQAKALLKAKNLDIISDKKLKLVRQKINKENFKKITRNKLLESAKRKSEILRANNLFKKTVEKNEQVVLNNTNSVPVVPKFIISLNGDSSSEEDDDSSNQTDVVRSIDLFLQEVRIENDLKQGLVNQQVDTVSAKPNQVKSDEVQKPIAEVKSLEKNNIETNVSDAAQIITDKLVNVKHLPLWQQQEYHRLKKQIEEKERVIKTTKEKVLTTFEKDDAEKDVKYRKKDEEKINEKNDIITRNKININNETDKESSSKINVTNGINRNKANVINKETNLHSNVKSINSPPKHIINSYKLVQEVSHMSKMIEYLEKEMNSFRDMYKILVQKKKELLIAKLNIAKKKKVLFEIRKKLVSKEKLIQTRMEQTSLSQFITKTDQNDAKKQVSRDLELCKLRMREFNLRSKMIFDEIDHSGLTKLTKQTKGVSSIEKTMLPLKSNQNNSVLSNRMLTVPKFQSAMNIKEKSINKNSTASNKPISVAEKQTETWDPFVPVCPFDLSGVCKDEECKFQHIKAA